MSDNINQELQKHFQKHRIIFWYDEVREYLEAFGELSLDGVEKILINNNEFAVKYQILRKQPKQKFLIYRPHSRPIAEDNWLLDIELWAHEIRVDEIGLCLAELGLEGRAENIDLIKNHIFFFKNAKRREKFKAIIAPNDDNQTLVLKIISVCLGIKSFGFEDILLALLNNLLGNDEKIETLLAKSGLDVFIFGQLKRRFGYEAISPSIKDFCVWLFDSMFNEEIGERGEYFVAKGVFIDSWKNNRNYFETFKALSTQFAKDLGIASRIDEFIAKNGYGRLLGFDNFRSLEPKIIICLIGDFIAKTLKPDDFYEILNVRKKQIWFEDYQNYYAALENAILFNRTFDGIDLRAQSFDDGVKKYTNIWYLCDQFYRKFIYHYQIIEKREILNEVFTQVENKYNNSYLFDVCNNWQQTLKAHGFGTQYKIQSRFFKDNIKPIIDNDKKVFVIISDALRYEIGEELAAKILEEDRFDAKTEPMIASLPSYTQLGMASLLPNETLAFRDDDSGHVFADGQRTDSTEYRNKILSQFGCAAVQAKEVLAFSSDELREIMKANKCLYIYHNQIDFIGDKRETEKNVFKACEDAIGEIIALIKKLSSNNASNIIVTADHGFLFQYSEIEDFLSEKPVGDELLYQDRRFIIGRGLGASAGFAHFSESDLGLSGNLEVLIPNSLNRLLRKGSGARFVHGGAALQEMIVPVVHVNKKRQSDIEYVDIEILNNAKNITSGQLNVKLYQTRPVSEKIKARTLNIGLYSINGELISNQIDYVFDSIDVDVAKREHLINLVLNAASSKNNKEEVYLILKEKISKTNRLNDYKKTSYFLKRYMDNDF